MKPLFYLALRYGLIGGVLAFICVWVLFALGRHPFLIPVFLDFRIIILAMVMVLTLREFRTYRQQGVLYLWQGMLGGYATVFTTALTGSLLVWLLATLHAPFVEDYVLQLTNQLQQNAADFIEKVGKETFESQLAQLNTVTALDLALDYFLKCMIIGLLLTIVISVLLRKLQKPTNYGKH